MSILDDLILKIDNSVDLYGKLKTFDEHWGVQIRANLEAGLREDFSLTSDNILFWGSLVKDVEHLSPLELFTNLLFRTHAAGTGSTAPPPIDSQALIDAYRESQRRSPVKLNYRPTVSDNSVKRGSEGITVRVVDSPASDSSPIPVRKLRKPGIYVPGTSPTDYYPPISAQTELLSRHWGELACYPVEESAIVEYIAPTAFEVNGVERDAKSVDAFMAFLGIDSIPLPVKEKEMLKQSLPYWAASGLITPQSIRGLAGDVGFCPGAELILNLAESLRVRSQNAVIGSDASFYLDVQFAPFTGSVSGSRNYADVPFFAGRSSLKQDLIDLAGKDIGYFLGIPWEQRSKAVPKQSNLQILFYPKAKPPYGSGRAGSPRLRPAEFNIPDPKSASWSEIKAACAPYMAGRVNTSVMLSNGRKMSVFASTKEEGRTVLNRMLVLTTATKAGDFTYVEADDYGRQVQLMYPGSAVVDSALTSENPGQAKFLLWVDSEDKANFRIYGTSAVN